MIEDKLTMQNLKDIDIKNKRVLIREDLNVPIHNGEITNDTRIKVALPTIEYALKQNAAVIVLSHLGRPKEGEPDARFSLEPVAKNLSALLNKDVRFVTDWLDGVDIQPGEIVLCENVRFNVGEKQNDETLSKKMARLCDVFVMDAFATAHRAHASTYGVAQFSPIACAGPLLIKELENLGRAIQGPKKPVLAIVGGAKISSKLVLLKQLLDKVDQLVVGGGIANTFLAAKGLNIGQSLHETDLIPEAQQIIQLALEKNVDLPLPMDVIVAKEFSETAKAEIKNVNDVANDDIILDVGPRTALKFAEMASLAKTIIWNGPLGVFEYEAFSNGTLALAHAIAYSEAFSLAGGGDTIAAIDQFNLASKISYISSGGGAFLSVCEGKTLPAVAMLEQRNQTHVNA